jgi:hypothetical protein
VSHRRHVQILGTIALYRDPALSENVQVFTLFPCMSLSMFLFL